MNKINFIFNQQLFNELEPVIDIAIKAGETSAKVEDLEEQHDELETKVEQVENRQRWNDESIDFLREEVNQLRDKIDTIETKEEIEEENDPTIHEEKKEEEEETIIEKTEEEVGIEPKSNLGTIIGTMIFGTIIVFLIKLYESRGGGRKE